MIDRDHPSAIGPIVINNRAAERFEVLLEGEVAGFVDYVEFGDRVELPHTVIDRSMRGRGLAAVLIERALDDVRSSGRWVVPTCWYVAQFIDSHPDYADLVAPSRSEAPMTRSADDPDAPMTPMRRRCVS